MADEDPVAGGDPDTTVDAEPETPEETEAPAEEEAEVPAEDVEAGLEGEEEEEKQELQPEDVVDDAEETAYTEARERRKDIEKKYPNLFKEFPQLRASLFRDVQFREVFPTVDEAREASQKAQFVDTLGQSLMAGDPEPLFKSVYQEFAESLNKLVGNFLPTLQKRSMPLYMRAVDFGLRHFVKAAHEEGVRTGNRNLELAAQHIANFGFGSPDIPEVRLPAEEETPEVKRLRGEIQQRDQATFTAFNQAVVTDAKAQVMKLINNTIDPNKALPQLVREGLVRKAFDEIADTLESDQAHNARMTRLWKTAREQRFPAGAKPSILNAYLGRVRATLPDIRRRYRSEGIKSATQGSPEPAAGKKPISGTTVVGSRMPSDPKKIDWNKTSDRDLLDGKITLKRA